MSLSLFCDHITVLDIAYFDAARGLVGASYHVNIELLGSTDDEGILMDFSKAKKAIKSRIDEICDHRFVLPQGLAKWTDSGFSLELSYGSDPKHLYYEGPRQALCEIPYPYISKSHIASYLEQELQSFLGDHVKEVRVKLEAENLGEQPLLHYTHGLRQHYGNCQRLFHGHQNSVRIWVNEQARPDLESWLIRDVLRSNIHFCWRENLVQPESVLKHLAQARQGIPFGAGPIEIAYTGNQGFFRAFLPADEVYILNDESTVENLSLHFAHIIKDKIGDHQRVRVKAFEGIQKGAISNIQ